MLDLDPLPAKTKKHLFYITERQAETTSLTSSGKKTFNGKSTHAYSQRTDKKEKTERSLEAAPVEGRLQQTHIRFCVVREMDERDVDRIRITVGNPFLMETWKWIFQ
uniref:Uncharacterized protein n=1 Tax=Cucumis melo TaxID=3656 RepID=A0A9I9E101_CUCME